MILSDCRWLASIFDGFKDWSPELGDRKGIFFLRESANLEEESTDFKESTFWHFFLKGVQ